VVEIGTGLMSESAVQVGYFAGVNWGP
jgi:hypothetical protein